MNSAAVERLNGFRGPGLLLLAQGRLGQRCLQVLKQAQQAQQATFMAEELLAVVEVQTMMDQVE